MCCWRSPALLSAGYNVGDLLEKSSSSREGVATFVRRESGWVVDEYVALALGGAGADARAGAGECGRWKEQPVTAARLLPCILGQDRMAHFTKTRPNFPDRLRSVYCLCYSTNR